MNKFMGIWLRANEAIQGSLRKIEQDLLRTATGERLVTSNGEKYVPTLVGRKAGIGEINDLSEISASQVAKSLLINDAGQYSKKRMAAAAVGGYTGISAAGRILSGGGLYRDSDGNFDVIGIPVV